MWTHLLDVLSSIVKQPNKRDSVRMTRTLQGLRAPPRAVCFFFFFLASYFPSSCWRTLHLTWLPGPFAKPSPGHWGLTDEGRSSALIHSHRSMGTASFFLPKVHGTHIIPLLLVNDSQFLIVSNCANEASYPPAFWLPRPIPLKCYSLPGYCSQESGKRELLFGCILYGRHYASCFYLIYFFS